MLFFIGDVENILCKFRSCMNLFVYKKYIKNIFLSAIFLVNPSISMEKSSLIIVPAYEHDALVPSESMAHEKKVMNFHVEYLDDILSDSTDSLGNIITFKDKYSFFVHEFSQLGLGSFETFFKKQLTKKAQLHDNKIIATPKQIDDLISAAEKKIVQAYLSNQEYQNHIHQVILDAIQVAKKVDEVEDALFQNLTGISFLQPVMTAYIDSYKEVPYDLDSQDEEDYDYEDRLEYNDLVKARDSLFSEALSSRNDSFIDFFIAYQVDVDCTGASDDTLLHQAAKYNNAKVTAFLLVSEGAKKNNLINETNDKYQCPLHVAAEYNADEVTLQLLQYGVDINQNANLSVNYKSPLYYAIKHNSDKVARILIDHGAHLENLLLMIAAKNNAYKVIPYLLTAKFQSSHQDVICALSKAAKYDAVKSAQLLLDSLAIEYAPVFLPVGTDPENKFYFEVADQSMSYCRKDILYADPLFCVVLHNSEKVMQLFLQHKKINQHNFLQKSNLLEVAVSHDADKIVKLLIAAGMDIHALGYENLNLLQRAAKNTAYKSIPLLLEAGLHVDNQMLLSCLQPYFSKLSNNEQDCAVSLIEATNSSSKKRKINY